MPMMSNKAEKKEVIEILDHGYVVRKGSREIYRCSQSKKSSRCARSECRRKHMKSSLRMRRIRRLRKKAREKKKERETKEKSREITSAKEEPHLLSQQSSDLESTQQQSDHSSSVPLIDSSTIVDLSIESEHESLPESISMADPLPSPTQVEVPTCLHDDTIEVVRKVLWNINSAYYCQGVLGEEDVGDSPNVRLEPEPTNLSDPNAIKLMFQAKNGEWVHGGYVPKVETQRVRNLDGSIIGVRVAFWRNRGYWRAPYVQLLYKERIKRVVETNQTLLTPSIITESSWVFIHSCKHRIQPRRMYGKWLLFVDKKQLDSVWHRVAYNVQIGYFGKGCTVAKCSTARETPYCTDSREGVICVYTTRSTVNHVGFKLSKLTRLPKIRYKTNAATMAGIFAGDPGCTTKTITYNNGIPRLSNTKTKLNNC